MEKINDIISYVAHKDAKMLVDFLDESYSKFPKKFTDPNFHNNVLIEFYRLAEELLDMGDTTTPDGCKLRNSRRVMRDEYLKEVNNALNNLQDYKYFISDEFKDVNNGETIQDFLNDMENIQIYEVLIRDYGTSPRFKQFLEKNYIDAQNGMDYIEINGIEAYYELLQESTRTLQDAFPNFKFSYNEALGLLMRITIMNMETLINGRELLNSITYEEPSSTELSHKVTRIRKKNLVKLFNDFDKAIEEIEPIDDPKKQEVVNYRIDRFNSAIRPLKNRIEKCPFDKVQIHSREWENTVLMNIITFLPFQLVPFIKFLLDQEIKLPLSNYKNFIYPAYFLDYDSETISNAFMLENEGEMYNMDEIRKQLLSPEELEEINKNLIHIEGVKKPIRKIKRKLDKNSLDKIKSNPNEEKTR